MKEINNYIQEKLILGKNLKISDKQTDEVLVVPMHYKQGIKQGYDKALILNVLEDFQRKYIFDDIVIDELTPQYDFYYSLYNKAGNHIKVSDDINIINIFLYNGSPNIIKTSCFKEFVDIIKSSKGKYLGFKSTLVPFYFNYLYIWISKKEQCLRIKLSNYTYENLKSKNVFK